MKFRLLTQNSIHRSSTFANASGPLHHAFQTSFTATYVAQTKAVGRPKNRSRLKGRSSSSPLFPREIDQMLKDIAAQIKNLRSRRDVSYDGIVRRELTDEELLALKTLQQRQRELEEQKYGIALP